MAAQGGGAPNFAPAITSTVTVLLPGAPASIVEEVAISVILRPNEGLSTVTSVISVVSTLTASSSSSVTPAAVPNISSIFTLPLTSSSSTITNAAASATPVSSSLIPSSSNNIIASSSVAPSQSAASSNATSAIAQSDGASGSGIGGGAAAGLAIGMLIAGALIAGLIAFLLIRRRKRRQPAWAGEHQMRDSPSHSEKGPSVAVAALGAGTAAAVVEDYLPQPKEHAAIAGDFSRLKSKIAGHIETYYSGVPSDPVGAGHAIAQIVGPNSPIPVGQLSQILSNGQAGSTVLRAALAWTILAHVGTDRRAADSLLPPEMATLSSNSSQTYTDQPSRSAFQSKWRQITAALAGDKFTGEHIDASDPRMPNINKVAQMADAFLVYFATSRLDATLFSQPSIFHFDWSGSGQQLVVFPGLLEFSDGNGKTLHRPRQLAQQETAYL